MATPPSPASAVPGSEHHHGPRTRRTHAADPAQEITIAMVLRHRPDAPPLPDMEHWAATPPDRRRFLSREEFATRHGASDSDVDRATRFANSHSLTVDEIHPARRTVQLSGTIGQINVAFGITLAMYEAPGELYRGYDGPIHLPAEMREIVLAVFGLDTRRLAKRAGGSSLTITSLTPPNVAALYGFPAVPSSISGQTIGLFEFGGGYSVNAASQPTDVVAFLQGLNPPLPTPTVVPVPVAGGANTVLGGPGNTNNDDAEVALDIDVVSSVANGATIAVYFIGINTNLGWLAAVTAATIPLGAQPAPSVLSISWAWAEEGWSATQLQAISGYFQGAAASGVTIFAASGDFGSMGNADEPDGRAHVCYPACDPWVTAVGGTSIGNISGADFTEVTWNDNGVTAGGISTVTDGSGNLVFPPPFWQAGFNVPPSINDGVTRGRGIPDVAGYANGYDIQLYGQDAGVWWGTSEASPLYAALIAIMNANLGFNLGYLNPTFYQFAKTPGWLTFYDIADNGSNAFSFTLKPPNPPTTITSPGYLAVTGWDACTGLGSIRARRLYAALAGLPIAASAIAGGGDFGPVCVGSFVDRLLTINNSGFGLLAITAITSSSGDFITPSVLSYPLLVAAGASIDLVVRFQPSVEGPDPASLTITTNDPSSPLTIPVTGEGGLPRLALVMADTGSFPATCVQSFHDKPLILSNSSRCPLSVINVTITSGDFVLPEVLSYPLVIGPGASLCLPVRFQPAAVGSSSATITVYSSDPASPASIRVSGEAPAGVLTVTGSAIFGGVRCCTSEQRTIWLNNTGGCDLQVSRVELRRRHHAFRLVNDPFPVVLRSGASLAVVIEYRAEEREPWPCELVVHSNDPAEPVKCVPVVAYTNWDCCRDDHCHEACRDCCRPPRKCGCDERRKPHPEDHHAAEHREAQ